MHADGDALNRNAQGTYFATVLRSPNFVCSWGRATTSKCYLRKGQLLLLDVSVLEVLALVPVKYYYYRRTIRYLLPQLITCIF